MKILSINGSPRGRRSNTHKMIREILKGAKAKGAEVENIFLSNMNIEHCHGCFACWLNKNRECPIKDDMQVLANKWLQSDIVICGTPLHSDNISSMLKVFIDRCLPMISPYMEKDDKGEYKHKKSNFETPKCVVVSNGAYPEPSQFQVISHYFKRLSRNSNIEIIAEIYRGQGAWLSLPDFSNNRAYVDAYYELLNQVGEELITDRALSEKTQLKLSEPLGSYDEYINDLEGFWKKSIK